MAMLDAHSLSAVADQFVVVDDDDDDDLLGLAAPEAGLQHIHTLCIMVHCELKITRPRVSAICMYAFSDNHAFIVIRAGRATHAVSEKRLVGMVSS